jgi:hypothetical protein
MTADIWVAILTLDLLKANWGTNNHTIFTS